MSSNFNDNSPSDKSTTSGGYSDIRLWPCYLIFSVSVLALHLYLSLFISFMIIGAIGFAIAFYASKQIRQNGPRLLCVQLISAEADPKVALNKSAESTAVIHTIEPTLPVPNDVNIVTTNNMSLA